MNSRYLILFAFSLSLIGCSSSMTYVDSGFGQALKEGIESQKIISNQANNRDLLSMSVEQKQTYINMLNSKESTKTIQAPGIVNSPSNISRTD